MSISILLSVKMPANFFNRVIKGYLVTFIILQDCLVYNIVQIQLLHISNSHKRYLFYFSKNFLHNDKQFLCLLKCANHNILLFPAMYVYWTESTSVLQDSRICGRMEWTDSCMHVCWEQPIYTIAFVHVITFYF